MDHEEAPVNVNEKELVEPLLDRVLGEDIELELSIGDTACARTVSISRALSDKDYLSPAQVEGGESQWTGEEQGRPQQANMVELK